MRLRELISSTVTIGILTIGLLCQDLSTNGDAPPGNLQLLDGYRWTLGRSKDATIGRIVHDSGFSILFDKSAVRGFYNRKFSDMSSLEWIQSQSVNGQLLDIARFKNGDVAAYFGDTTRFAARPTSNAKLADFLLTLMTFGSSSNVVRSDSRPLIPGNIKLLPGYTNESQHGIDSHPGRIFKVDGLSIGYDIGGMAGQRAAKYFPENLERLRKQTHLNSQTIAMQIRELEDQIDWRQRQRINGSEVLAVQLKDSALIVTFVNSRANFFAKVVTEREMVDFLLTVLTYQPSEK